MFIYSRHHRETVNVGIQMGQNLLGGGAVITVTLKLRKQDGVIFSIVTFLPEFSFDGFQLGKLMI